MSGGGSNDGSDCTTVASPHSGDANLPARSSAQDVFTIATMSLSKAQNLLVELRTNQDINGWGEASSLRLIVAKHS
jgi:L-alanine-DL-glutamate epimerase-like enolase superfamily enzyme